MKKDLSEAITRLGLEFRLMTQFTSFVAVEEMIVTDGGEPRRIDVPIEVPEGVNREAVTGEKSLHGFSMLRAAPRAYSQTVTVTSTAENAIDTSSVGGTTKIDRSMMDPGSVVRNKSSKPKKGGTGGGGGGASGLGHGRGLSTEIAGADSRDDQRLHPVIAALLERLKQPKYLPNAEEAKFVHDGKAEIKVWLSEKSDSVVAKLKELGFEIVLDPKTSKLLVGRIPLAMLQKLIELKEVRFVAPQY
jgi:hypothetical protein